MFKILQPDLIINSNTKVNMLGEELNQERGVC